MPSILNWTNYWRNTLADGERNEIVPSSIDANLVYLLKPEQIKINSGSLDKALTSRLFALLDENEFTQGKEQIAESIPVLLSFFSITPKPESAISSEEKEMFPFWIKALLDRDGQLMPDEEHYPYIPRVFLEPQLVEKYFYTFSDVETIDSVFASMHENDLDWPAYMAGMEVVFYQITGQTFNTYHHDQYLTQFQTILVVNDALKGAADGIIRLYDSLKKNNTFSALYRRMADEESPKCKDICDIAHYEDGTLKHHGQMNYEFPMSVSQRDALYHFVKAEEGEVFAITGPPGTGKTTMLQNVVASEFVKAAIKGKHPCIIVAASTNNQAVVNIIDSFTKAKTKDGKLAGRWLPGVNSYGLYLPARNKNVAAEISPDILFYKTNEEGFPVKVQDIEYVGKAKDFYLSKFEDWAGYNPYSIQQAVDTIRKELLNLESRLSSGLVLWKAYKKTFHLIEDFGGKDSCRKYFRDGQPDIDLLENDLQKIKIVQSEYLNYLNQEPWWKKLFGIFFKQERAANLAALFNDCPISFDSIRFDRLQTLNDFFQKKFRLAGEIKALSNAWYQWKSDNDIKGNPPSQLDELKTKELSNQHYFYDELETGMKHTAFQLATHYWEGRWIMEMENMDVGDLRKRGKENTIRKWQRFAMLTPCFVSTFYMLPKFFTYSRFLGNLNNGKPSFETPPLIGEIDLLIVDEAGQVSPEIGMASFALAKKAIVVGDTRQIEPVWNVPQCVDYSNLNRYNIANSSMDMKRIEELDTKGFLGSSGSLMQLAQKSCSYQLPESKERGFLLKEHRRCYNEIIAYCNKLAYNNQLEPRRGPSKNLPFIPMALVHVDGISEKKNSSRANKIEAEAIAAWMLKYQSYLLDFYGKMAQSEYEKTDKSKPFRQPLLKDVVGIITPFVAQKYELERALRAKGINVAGMKIGTVHALQGAERPVVIFSAVYSGSDIGKGYFFDAGNKPNMLNVAVSRAKDCFIVFCNRNIFTKNGKTPSSLLYNFLKELS